jgi:hypothetical protein
LSGRCTLKIAKNVKDDEAEYSCVIDDTEKTSCYLYVEEPAFKFTKRLPTQVEGNEGQNGELECEIEDEDAECDWYVDGKKIDLNDEAMAKKYDIVVNGLKRKLVVKKCDPKTDRGRYECKCGVVTTGTEFFVKPSLKISKKLQDTEGIEESSVELAVEVTKPNQKAKWTRNGRPINPNEERFAGRYIIISDGLIHKCTINNLKMNDAGEFSVQVEELTDNCKLTVKECKQILHINHVSLIIY